MATIVISSDSDCVLSDLDDDADAEFERDLKEAKRLSILESRAKIHDEETSEMIKIEGFERVKEECSISMLNKDPNDNNNSDPECLSIRDKDEFDELATSSDDSDSSIQILNKGETKYLNDDKSVPIYDVRSSGCTYSEAVKALLDGNDSLICKKQPILVEENYMLLVDLSALDDPDDIKSDDCGHWIHNGRKSTTVTVKSRNGKVVDVKSITGRKSSIPQDENSRTFRLVRTYYSHDPNNYFKRIFYHIFDSEEVRHHLCLVQYYFDKNKPHEIQSKPHGNSKTEQPYYRTMKSVHNTLQQSTGNATPKQALANSIQKCGRLLGARSVGCLPKSRSQVRYHQSKNKTPSTSDSLFNVMLQCKSTDQDSDNAFVRTVVAAPEPMAVLATNRQMNDMVRFLTDLNHHTVMGIDPTFNFGDFNVTPIAFQYLLLEHRKQGHSPVILGPLLVHQQKKFSSYHFFASTLISLCPGLRNIRAFGTDGETQLYQAFQMQLPDAVHLRCFRHFRANLITKLKALGMTSEIIDQFMRDIFGVTIDGLHEVGLVDCSTEEEFDEKLQALQEQWNCREKSVVPSCPPTFYHWFVKEKSTDIKSNMLLSLREAAGLGSPPSPYYTNANESLNNMLHEKVKYKKSQWHEFNESMKQLVAESYRLIELAVIDVGDFKFKRQYQDLIVPQRRWLKMTPKQREHHLSKVASVSVKDNDCTNVSIALPSLCTTPANTSLTVPLNAVNIPSLSRDVVEGIWRKAEYLISTPGQVIEAPCSSSNIKCYVVASKSSDRPHIVKQSKSGQFSCEPSCLMWQSSKVCAHCVAAADYSNHLEEFLTWYKGSKSKPNLGKLSKANMPNGSGRKGEKPPRKKRKESTACLALTDRESSLVSKQNTSLSIENSVSPSDSSTSNCPSSFMEPPPSQPWMNMSMQNQYNQQPYFQSPSLPTNFSFSQYYPQVGYQAWHAPPGVPLGCPSQSATSPAFQPQQSLMPSQGNPFFVRFISGNIRVCQGCRGSLRLPDGSIPGAPSDIAVARLEKRPYFDRTSGTWCYPQKETNSHYHAKLSCVVKAEPLFVPSTLQLPPETILTPAHLDLLAREFGVTVNSH